MRVAIILLLLHVVFVLPTLSCRAAWRWVPFEKTHHQHQAGQQGSSGWKYSLATTLCIAVLMAITISHRRSSSWSHHWYVQDSGIMKMFQGSQSLCYYYAVRRLSLNNMNYADLCRGRDFMKTVFLYTVESGYCQDTALGRGEDVRDLGWEWLWPLSCHSALHLHS